MGVILETGRFGQLNIQEDQMIEIPQGVLGFSNQTRFSLIDPGDETLILWLQSVNNPEIAFPVLEPKIFRANYSVRLSGNELRLLKLDNVKEAAVYSILTIPEDVTQMTANLKAPLVINTEERIAKQVVLQENEYSIKHLMFKELRAHLITIQSQQQSAEESRAIAPIRVQDIPKTPALRNLQVV